MANDALAPTLRFSPAQARHKTPKPGQGHEQNQRGGRQDLGCITGIKPVRRKGGQSAERKKGKRPAE